MNGSAPPEELRRALDQAKAVRKELDRKVFHLKTLSETIHESRTLGDPAQIMRSFLLAAMGVAGTGKGFVLAMGPGEEEPRLVSRNLAPEEEEHLLHCFAETGKTQVDNGAAVTDARPSRARLVMHNKPSAASDFPPDTELVLGWTMDQGGYGLLGLGSALSGDPYSGADKELLSSLLDGLAQGLETAHSHRTIHSLNQDLAQKNIGLEQALQASALARAELDLRIFHLNTLYDAALELSPLKDSGEIMRTFLLLLQGVFSLQSDFLLLHDRTNDALRTAWRGELDREPEISPAQAKEVLFHCIGSLDFDSLAPLKPQFLPAQALGDPVLAALPLSPAQALVFRLDEQTMGLICLGEKHTGDDFTESEKDVLITLAGNFLLFLKNARAFETIQALNRELEQSNLELRHTIDELTASRHRIEILERAGAKIRGLLQREARRLGRVSKFDFLWIVMAALVLGLLFNLSNPNGVDLVPVVWKHPRSETIDPQTIQTLYENGEAVFVDARPAEFHKQEHLADSINMPPSLFDFIYTMKFGEMDLDQPIVLYGRTISSRYDEEVAIKLRAQGHENIRVVPGGFKTLKRLGLPVASAE